jgi:hypothetical protein
MLMHIPLKFDDRRVGKGARRHGVRFCARRRAGAVPTRTAAASKVVGTPRKRVFAHPTLSLPRG